MRGVRCDERGHVSLSLSSALLCATCTYMCTATADTTLPAETSVAAVSALSLSSHASHTHTYTVTSHELSQPDPEPHWAHTARTHLSDTRRRRWRRRRHPPGRARCSSARPAARLPALAALAATFARCGVPWPLRCRRRPRSTEAARARAGLERRLASPRLDRRSAPVARAARALAVRAPAAIASAAAAERGGVEEEAILRAVVGRGSAPMGSACSFSSRGAHLQAETGRGTRVWWSWVSARAGRHPRLGAPEGGVSESPRWSGRAVGSRRTAWRLGGR